MTETLLIEIGTEELPPKALPTLARAFAGEVEKSLDAALLPHGAVTTYASPRRLAVSISDVVREQPDRTEQRRGPALKAAFDGHNPTKAALGFARSCGVELAQLGRLKTDQGEWLSFESRIVGKRIDDLVEDIIANALDALPIPKRMRWGAGDVEFVRPAHWAVVLYGSETIACKALGMKSGRVTRGHRVHHGGGIELERADDYATALRSPGFVIASFEARRQRIVDLIAQHTRDHGGEAVVSEALLDEVTALVEWPVLVAGTFDPHFLALPEEVLIASMQDHQKYFPLRAAGGELSNAFITISNIESREPDVVRAGNERVIRPRLADADFFYATDRKRTLESRLADLGGVTFEKRLGSLLDKTRRVQEIAERIAPACGCEVDPARRAAELARCDLLSEMVGEFPELQGVMGGYYAAADHEPDAVGRAIGEFYYPRFAGDRIPGSALGRCIAIADRLDSLVGIFGIGSAPTGDKDPFALRRAALGVLRILVEGEIDLDLDDAIEITCACYARVPLAEDTASQVHVFMRERLRGYYLERNIPPDVCAAVFANNPGSPVEIARRIEAVVEFRALDAARALAAANKRIANILRKSATPIATTWSHALLSEPAERALALQLEGITDGLEQQFRQRDYSGYMLRLASLREGIDGFFDDVMVMSEDDALRANRLALLTRLHGLFTRVADIALLHDA